MKILSVDTSTPTCTVGLVDGDRVLAEFVDSSGQTHARHLMGMIDSTVSASGIPVQDIDGFAVVTGPGTFTGLRIGIGTIKGLAFALSKPVVGVASLTALAAQADRSTKFVCPVMDARRNEVYYSLFVSKKGALQQVGKPRVAPPSELVKNVHESCQFVGNGAHLYREMFETALGPLAQFSRPSLDTIQAGTIAKLALKQFQENEIQSLHAVAPYYIRRSDAEVHVGNQHSSRPPLS
jgi:tRNA threonylcarbamoyladenosine biosynthesis protein TsaB